MNHELGFDLADFSKLPNISEENIAAIRDSVVPHVPIDVTDKQVRHSYS